MGRSFTCDICAVMLEVQLKTVGETAQTLWGTRRPECRSLGLTTQNYNRNTINSMPNASTTTLLQADITSWNPHLLLSSWKWSEPWRETPKSLALLKTQIQIIVCASQMKWNNSYNQAIGLLLTVWDTAVCSAQCTVKAFIGGNLHFLLWRQTLTHRMDPPTDITTQNRQFV